MSVVRIIRFVALAAVVYVAAQGTLGAAQTLDGVPQAPLSPDAVVVTMAPGQNADAAIPNGFGITSEHISVVGWASFTPYISSATFNSDTGNGARWTTGGSSWLYAPVPEDIPNGAIITQVVFYVQDTNATYNFTGRLCRYYTDSGAGGSPGGDCPFSVSTTGTPGDTVAFGDPGVVLMRRVDLTGDGPIEVINWVLRTDQSLGTDGTIRIHQVRLLWKRQISPAPASASFTDVPTSYWAFQYVEALRASGITGGVTPTTYEPESPVTRAQMAVFLAKALGLHWPAF